MVIISHVRYTIRMLLRKPLFAAVAVAALALGIGANTAVFTVLSALLLRPLPYEDPSRIVAVWETQPRLPNAPVSPPDFLDWQRQNNVFEAMAAGTDAQVNLAGADEARHLQAAAVSPGLLQLLGVQPALGRAFRSDEDHPGQNVALLSHRLWQDAFGGDPAIIGRTIILEGEKFDVVGVMPVEISLPDFWRSKPDIWVPLTILPGSISRGTHMLWVIGRLRPGVTIQQAQAEMTSIAEGLAKEYPATNANIGARVVSLREQLVGNTRPVLLLLMGATAFLLLMACANVASLMLAQAFSRRREIATRLAIGADRRHLIRQLLTETSLLAVIGGGAGVIIGELLLRCLLALSPPDLFPAVRPIRLDAGVLGLMFAVSAATGILLGFAPAFQVFKANVIDALKEAGGTATRSGRGLRLLRIVVVCEIACASLLLVGAGLMIRSLSNLLQIRPGYEAKNVVTLELTPSSSAYSRDAERVNLFRAITDRVSVLAGVASVGITNKLPLAGGLNGSVNIDGEESGPMFQGALVEFSDVTPGYFSAMGIPLWKGRLISEEDSAAGPKVAVINEAMVRHFWPNQDPIGKRFSTSTPPQWIEVVGVVGDVRQWGLARPPLPEAYFPYAQRPDSDVFLVVRSQSTPELLVKPIRRQVQDVDKSLPTYNIRTMDEVLGSTVAKERFETTLLGLFALLALVLAVTGIYGVMAYSVSQRTQEISVRMALGAQSSNILIMVLKQGLGVTLVGAGVGLMGALGLSRFVSSLLYGVTPGDPLTYLAVTLLVSAVALLACYVPARRATRVDPLVALRYE